MSVANPTPAVRRLPIGAEPRDEGGTHFRVWAPRRRAVEVVFEGAKPAAARLEPEPGGYFAGWAPGAQAGDRYRFRVDDGRELYPDPASRFQPEGPHGPSEIVDPTAYVWSDAAWRGPRLAGQVVYEMHIGTFTPEGTFAAAARELAELAALGIGLIEVMPIADFAGRFGWGYDGVDLFAPTRLYGRPDDFRRFVDQAHALDMGVILDVVYNHLGPSGNFLGAFSPYYLARHKTDWGESINFDGEGSAGVREFFVANAGYWIAEFRLDGLRLDAIHAIRDDSPEHVVAAIGRRVREAAGERRTIVVAENESQEAHVIAAPAQGGFGLDAAWSDDFHHAARVAATGHAEFYYGDYQGSPQEIVSAVRHGFLYQGQWNARLKQPRGTAARGIPAERFVFFLQNHDQVANSAQGLRSHLLTSPGRHRALTAVLLLAPETPLLFQGQEFSASAPFHFFADHEVDLARLVREGREEFLRQFDCLQNAGEVSPLVDPCDRQTFEASKLDLSERARHAAAYALHRDLLRLRREDPTFSAQRGDRIEGAVLGAEAFLLRYYGDDGEDRLLVCNLGRDLVAAPLAEPTAAAPAGTEWALLWSSEDSAYGGSGSGLFDARRWRLPGHAAIVLRPRPTDSSAASD